MTANKNKDAEVSTAKGAAPVVSVHELDGIDFEQNMRRLGPASLMSVVFHCVLLGLFAILAPKGIQAVETERKDDGAVAAETQDEARKESFQTNDINSASTEPRQNISYVVNRIAEVSVPGHVSPDQQIGMTNAEKDAPPTNVPPPSGFGANGTGSAIDGLIGNTPNAIGDPGGYRPRGVPLPGSFYGRSGATRERLLIEDGGTRESEAAVERGLAWLARHQENDGHWKLDGRFPDKGNANDAAGAALGLLPFLGAGKTHKVDKDNPYKLGIDKALRYLVNIQDKKTGAFSRDMYAHGLCTIAMCEAFGLSQDYNLRKSAQAAIDFIVSAQHAAGGWRYSPGQAGDTSVTGWQIMALKSGLMCGLVVPAASLLKAQIYLEQEVLHAPSEGYGYTDGKFGTPSMTAVALLCRQYLQAWGSQNLRMIKGVDTYIKPNYPKEQKKDVYFYYYATQVMHHFGGDDWKNWNKLNRDLLVKTQNKDEKRPDLSGSWSPAGDQWGQAGGRLMVTSLNILSLEVYYRYLPLYYRDNGGKNEPNVAKGR